MQPAEDKPILNLPEDKPVVQKPIEKPVVQKPVDKPILNVPEQKPEEKPEKEEPGEDKPYAFVFNKDQTEPQPESDESKDDGEPGLFSDEEDFKLGKEIAADQVINEEGMMEYRQTKARLEQQAKERREKIKGNRKQEMTKEEFNEKWTLPAYLRRGVKMDNVPHSSEPYISKYNLNDDNNLLGNNKFLHDNVD